jgi:hypothetical protein
MSRIGSSAKRFGIRSCTTGAGPTISTSIGSPSSAKVCGDHRHDADDGCRRDRSGGIRGLLEPIERAGADVAVDNAERRKSRGSGHLSGFTPGQRRHLKGSGHSCVLPNLGKFEPKLLQRKQVLVGPRDGFPRSLCTRSRAMISGLAERAVSGWGGEDRRGLILAERCGAFRRLGP